MRQILYNLPRNSPKGTAPAELESSYVIVSELIMKGVVPFHTEEVLS